jgi:hypothetical protein
MMRTFSGHRKRCQLGIYPCEIEESQTRTDMRDYCLGDCFWLGWLLLYVPRIEAAAFCTAERTMLVLVSRDECYCRAVRSVANVTHIGGTIEHFFSISLGVMGIADYCVFSNSRAWIVMSTK